MDGQAEAALAAYRRAAELAEDLLARNPKDWMTLANLAVYDLHVGADERARENIETAVANDPEDPDVLLANAVVKTQLGQDEQALDSLERAAALGCFPKWMIAGDPRFSALRGNDRFERLVTE
jgi:tetratricopeptide (TPR) repeat protein